MSLLSYIEKYVKTGTAEGDRQFLAEIFCPPDQFSELCAIEPGGMRLLIGDKGLGKSAIVEHIYSSASDKKIPSLILRPDDLVSKTVPAVNDLATLKNYYYENLVRSIAVNIGKRLKGLLIGSKKTLYDEARAAGLSTDDVITKSLELFSAISASSGGVNGVELAKKLAGSNPAASLVQAINNTLLSNKNVFYLLIDDTDQIAAPTQPEHLNRIWALILAVRKIVGECPEIRPIITLRTGVWTRMSTESRGQRDQTDHLRGYEIQLSVNERNIKEIIRKRLLKAAIDMARRGVDPYGLFFDGDQVYIPSTEERRNWDDFICKSSRDRPRDAIQLIKNMIESSSDKNKKIDSNSTEKALKIYSSKRVEDVSNEFSLDCSNIKEVMDTFYYVNFRLSFEKLRNHLTNIPGIGATIVRSRLIKQGDDEDAIVLLSLLHEVGFINPRVKDSEKRKDYDHVLYRDNPFFVRSENWSEMQAVEWEVHPAFRSYLIGKKEARKRQFGV